MILIKNGYVLDPASSLYGDYDVLIEGDLIKALTKPGEIKASSVDESIDAAGKLVTPGLIDIHVHLREPGFEWKETIASGSRAAIAGGFTTICCMPNTSPVIDNAEIAKFIHEKAKAANMARVRPLGSVSVGLKGEEMSPYSELAKSGCVAFSDDGKPVSNSLMMRRALEWCSMIGKAIACHEEDCSLCGGGAMNESALSSRVGLGAMPKVGEDVMVARDIELARLTGAHVHFCHVSTARSVELIRRAKSDGIKVSAEVTPHHLVLTESAILECDADAKMSPPLRNEEDIEALIEGLCDGTIDAVASDHAPHELDKKRIEFGLAAFGIIGLQSTLPLMLDLVEAKRIPINRAFEAMTSSPAKAYSLEGGSLKVGSPADITIIDQKYDWTFTKDCILSLSKNSPFIGRKMKGRADTVIVGGRILYKNGIFAEC